MLFNQEHDYLSNLHWGFLNLDSGEAFDVDANEYSTEPDVTGTGRSRYGGAIVLSK